MRWLWNQFVVYSFATGALALVEAWKAANAFKVGERVRCSPNILDERTLDVWGHVLYVDPDGTVYFLSEDRKVACWAMGRFSSSTHLWHEWEINGRSLADILAERRNQK